jgi:hypothetical protein
MDSVALQLALAPFVAFVVIIGAFIYFKNRKNG